MAKTKTYSYLSERERVQQHFDIENIMLTKAGQTYNVYEKIQEAREDTEILPTLLKYGCIDRLGIDKNKVYGDLTAIQTDFRNVIDQQNKAMELWESLPVETRSKYNNSVAEFLDRAPNDLKKEIDEEKRLAEEAKAKQQAVLEQGATNNE